MSITTQKVSPATVATQTINPAAVTPEQLKKLVGLAFIQKFAEIQQPSQQDQVQTVDENTILVGIVEVIQQLVNVLGELVKNILGDKKAPAPTADPAPAPTADPAPAPTADPAPAPTADPAPAPTADPAPAPDSAIIDKEKMDGRFKAADTNSDGIVTLDEYKEYFANRAAAARGKDFEGEDDDELAQVYKQAENVFKAIAKKDPITDKLELTKDRFDKIVKYYDSKDGEADGKINENYIIRDIIKLIQEKGKGEIKSATGKTLEEVLDAMA